MKRDPRGRFLRSPEIIGRITRDADGRQEIFLGLGHPLARKNGRCYLNRYVAQVALGRKLKPEEHVHHKDRPHTAPDADQIDNLEVVHIQYHGRLHAWGMTVAGQRGPDGRFCEIHDPAELGMQPLPRFGAIIGNEARRALEMYEPRRRR